MDFKRIPHCQTVTDGDGVSDALFKYMIYVYIFTVMRCIYLKYKPESFFAKHLAAEILRFSFIYMENGIEFRHTVAHY